MPARWLRFKKNDYDKNYQNLKMNSSTITYFKQPEITFAPEIRSLPTSENVHPKLDIFGNQQESNADYFAFPTQIGQLAYSYTSLKKGQGPLTTKERIKRIILSLCAGLLFSELVYLTLPIQGPFFVAVVFLLPTLGLGLFQVYHSAFLHTNLFVGINGFAEFQCEFRRENISQSKEYLFADATNMYYYQQDVYKNFVYSKSNFTFIWFNRKTGQILYKKTGEFNKKVPLKRQPITLAFCRSIENMWTIYLTDQTDELLKSKGKLSFYLYPSENESLLEYIQLGLGAITFLKDSNSFTYRSEDIKQMFLSDHYLVIQHTNFRRNMLFFKSGNEDRIPLLNLCDRQYFFDCLEYLLGYKIKS